MYEILIFGGTTEGRLLAEYCHEFGIGAVISVTSGYGKDLLPEDTELFVLSGRLTEGEMVEFIRKEKICLVFDATHPYAVEVTKNIKAACGKTGARYLRVVRESTSAESQEERIVCVNSVEEAVRYLAETEGEILVTTGSKDLPAYAAIPGYEKRIFARVLPSGAAIAVCESLGLRGKHIIAMQGPFSEAMNRAMMEQFGIRYLVTKEAGMAGGFREKMTAADKLSVTVVVIGRPDREEGISLDKAKELLVSSSHRRQGRHISLIGTGMGGPGQMTVAAVETLRRCDVLFGAERMLEAAKLAAPDTRSIPIYSGCEIIQWLEDNPGYRRAGILYSGDTGFYSGAAGITSLLAEETYSGQFSCSVYPGISSVSYLCARLNRGWEHVKLLSLHGRECEVAEELEAYPDIFVLLGGEHTVRELCGRLIAAGFGEVRVTVGERLSYPDERIVTGTPAQCAALEFCSLAAVLIERDKR